MIGICTPYKINNYGTKLQAYAVQEKIKELGYDCEIINFNRKSDLRIGSLIRRYGNIEYFQTKFNKNKVRKADVNDIKIRNDAINSFDLNHYNLTNEIHGFKGLNNISNRYDALICGSDQIWLPTSVNNPTTTLAFGRKEIRRISFAPSFGISQIPKRKESYYRKFLTNFDYLSVREMQGAQIIDKIIGKEATVVLDPTLTVKKEVWDQLVKESNLRIDDKYVFCYFLGNEKKHRISVYNYARKKSLKIVTLAHFKQFNDSDEEYSDIKLYNVTPCDFISLIKNAEVVFTDSFHSTVFSILYNKEFFTFERFKNNDKKSANSRIYSLLTQLNLKDRICGEKEDYKIHLSKIDYNEVNKKLNVLKNKTDKYLNNALSGLKKHSDNTYNFEEPLEKNCCGCTACSSICPKGCIKIVQDAYTGFHYPKMEHPDKCIHCGLCSKVCPIKNNKNAIHSISNPLFVESNNIEVRKNSSSGGVFYEIANLILDKNGVVFGASYDESFTVKHIMVENKNQLELIVKSKYAESCLDDTFKIIKKLLQSGKLVLFSGTPCQINGLKRYLVNDYENLITFDLLCYGIQSPNAWEKYKEDISHGRKIKKINMRDKTISWQNYSMSIEFTNGEKYLSSKKEDPYLKSYSKGLFIRESCYNCSSKAFPRKSDITAGDFWDIDKIIPNRNDGLGASIIFVNTNKGQEIIDELVYNKKIIINTIDQELLKKYHPLFCLNSKKSKKSKKFFKLLNDNIPFNKIVKRCEESHTKTKIKKYIKKIIKK